MQYRTTDVRTGLFILFSLVALTVLIFLMGGVRGAFRDAIEVRVLFDDVRLVEVEAPVTVGGYRIGEVVSISPTPDHRVEVRLAVNKDLDLRKDASAMVRTDGFLGAKFVALDPGRDARKLGPGEVIPGRAETDLAAWLAQLEEPVARLNRILGEVETFAEKPENAGHVEGILTESHELLRALREDLLPRADTALEEGTRTLRELAGAIEKRLVRLDGILADVERTITEARRGMNRVFDGAGRLLDDNNRNLYLTVRHLRDATAELERLARKVRADPSVVFWGDDEKVEPAVPPADLDELRRAGRARRYGKEGR